MPRLHETAFRLLIRDIVSGAFQPGTFLPREVDLAEEFSISRGVARECIRALEDADLIAVKHGVGATVNPSDRWDMLHPDIIAALLESDRRSTTITQYIECREILEVQAAELAATRSSKAHRQGLAEAVRRIEEIGARPDSPTSRQAMQEADLDFHRALTSASENDVLRALVERLHSALIASQDPTSTPRLLRAAPLYRAVLDAVSSRDAGAAQRATRDYLEATAPPVKGQRQRPSTSRSRR